MKEDKRQQRRERIVQAAIALFNRYGFRKTTLEDIAKEAGVGKATLYHYVEGKEELLAEMVERLFQRFKKRLDEVVALNVSSREKLVRYADAWLSHHREMQESSAMSLEERMEQFPDMHRHIRRFHIMEHKVMCALLQEGIDQGDFRAVAVEQVATLLVAAFKGMVAELWRKPGEYPPVAKGFLDVLFNGLLTQEARG
jgi:AcrR family transcriptional regulator